MYFFLSFTLKNRYSSHSLHTCKTATLVSEFVVEDLHLSRTAALVPEFAVNTRAEYFDDDDVRGNLKSENRKE